MHAASGPCGECAVRSALPELGVADAEDFWIYGGPPVSARQGWKLYISTTILNFQAILADVLPLLEKMRISFKHARSTAEVEALNSGRCGFSQIGKCIVLYIEEHQIGRHWIEELKNCLLPYAYKCPQVPYARCLGGSIPVYYRYGAYASDNLEIAESIRADNRSDIASAVPDEIEDVLLIYADPPQVDRDFDQFLVRFPVFQALKHSGKGGVFRALDISQHSLTEVVLKVGYRNGQMMEDGRDGFRLLQAEWEVLCELHSRAGSDLLPHLHGYQEFQTRNVLILESLAGPDLYLLKRDGKLSVGHIEAAIRILERVHQMGFVLIDAKLGNFVVSNAQSAELKLVDLDSAVDINDTSRIFRPSFWPRGVDLSDPCKFDRVHLLVSAVFSYDDAVHDRDRYVDVPDLVRSAASGSSFDQWISKCLALECGIEA